MIIIAITLIPVAYLLGSIPSAYIVGRLFKNIDMRRVGDGRIGAAAAFRNLGVAGGMLVGFMDFSKGVLAVALALISNVPLIIVLLCGLAAVIGHNWSIFLGFRGGRGAATTYGVLATLMLWQFLIALAIAAIPFFLTRKSSFATGIIFGLLPVLLWAESMLKILPVSPWMPDISPLLMVFPLFLAAPMVLKSRTSVRPGVTG